MPLGAPPGSLGTTGDPQVSPWRGSPADPPGDSHWTHQRTPQAQEKGSVRGSIYKMIWNPKSWWGRPSPPPMILGDGWRPPPQIILCMNLKPTSTHSPKPAAVVSPGVSVGCPLGGYPGELLGPPGCPLGSPGRCPGVSLGPPPGIQICYFEDYS